MCTACLVVERRTCSRARPTTTVNKHLILSESLYLILAPTTCRKGNFYRPQRSCGQGNVFTGVCLSTGGRVYCLSACWDAIPPRTRQTPPGPGRPPFRQGMYTIPPGTRHHPPLRTRQTPPPYQADTPPGTRQTPLGSRLQHTVYERASTHPTGGSLGGVILEDKLLLVTINFSLRNCFRILQ